MRNVRGSYRSGIFAALAIGLSIYVVFPGALGAAVVAPATQAQNFLRVLAYDRNFEKRFDYEITVASLYAPGDPASKGCAEKFLETVQSKGLGVFAKKLRPKLLPFKNPKALADTLGEEHVGILFVAEGLDSAADSIAALTRSRRIISVGATRASIEKGLSFGVVELDGKTGLLVNIPASKAEGTRFNAQLLRIAEVIR